MNFLTALLAFGAAIMLLVFIHEYGHYKVGRLLGVGARKFSIGFGKPLVSWTDKNKCQWQICPIPLGGYVLFVDGRNETLTEAEKPFAFDLKPLWARSLIVLAGPMANLAFALLAFFTLNMMGREESKPMMGAVIAQSVAAQGGFKDHMVIRSIGGEQVGTLSETTLALAKGAIEKRVLSVEAIDLQGAQRAVSLDLSGFDIGANSQDLLRGMGFPMPGPPFETFIHKTDIDSPAAKAGLLRGDKVLSINGAPLTYWSEIRARLAESPGKPVDLLVRAPSGAERVVKLIPDLDANGFPKIGVSLDANLSEEQKRLWLVKVDSGPVESAKLAARRCVEVTVMSLKAIGGMITGKDSTKGISGPVGIAEQAGKAASMGAQNFLGFLGFISLSLFLMNMLPIPALDGGHLLQYAIEGVTRRPLSLNAQALLGKIGFGALFALMFLALFNDAVRLLRLPF